MATRGSSLTQRGISRRSLIGNATKIGAGIAGLPLLAHQTSRSARAATEISMMGWGSPLEKENVDKGMQAFEGMHPDIAVDWIHTPNEEYETKLNTAMAGGNAPDVFWGSNMQDYVARGVAMDITSLLQADP